MLLLPAATAAVLTPLGWPRRAAMWGLAGAVYTGCKWLSWRRCDARGASVLRHAGFLLAWPGMDAGAFLDSRPVRVARPPAPASGLRPR